MPYLIMPYLIIARSEYPNECPMNKREPGSAVSVPLLALLKFVNSGKSALRIASASGSLTGPTLAGEQQTMHKSS